MDKLDCGAGLISYLCPRSGDHLDCSIVVLSYLMARNEGIDRKQSDVMEFDLRNDRFHDRFGDHQPAAVFAGDDKILITTAVEKEPTDKSRMRNFVVNTGGRDASQVFLIRIFESDVPCAT